MKLMSTSSIKFDLSVSDNTSDDAPMKKQQSINAETTWEKFTSCRWVLAYMGFFGFAIFYAIRTSISIAMICMLEKRNRNRTLINTNYTTAQQLALTEFNGTIQQVDINTDEQISWNKSEQGWVLSSYFYGYILSQLPFGYISGRFGGKRAMLIGMLTYGISTILLPFVIRIESDDSSAGAIAAIVFRVISGMASGAVYPATQNLWGKWAPPFERSQLNVFAMSGQMIGSVLVLGSGGFLCKWTDFDGGWPSIFYITGGLCLIFCLMWAFFVYDSPIDHPRISEKEREYILGSLEGVTLTKNKSVPWKQILTSPPVWAISMSLFCTNFGEFTLATKLPAYMKEVLGFEVVANGLYSVLPNIASFIVANTVSNVIDIVRRKQIITTTTARKLAMAIAFLVPAATIVTIGHIPSSLNYVAVILLTIAIGCTGFRSSGHIVNSQDIAATYAGEVYGFGNTIGTIPGLVAPPLVNYMTTEGTQGEWQTVFYVWAGVYCFGAAFYMTFASGEPQEWGKASQKDTDDCEKDEIA